MEEKVLSYKKNGMPMLALIILLYAAGIACVTTGSGMKGGVLPVLLLVVGITWIAVGWIPLMGLKILKPQEALCLEIMWEL